MEAKGKPRRSISTHALMAFYGHERGAHMTEGAWKPDPRRRARRLGAVPQPRPTRRGRQRGRSSHIPTAADAADTPVGRNNVVGPRRLRIFALLAPVLLPPPPSVKHLRRFCRLLHEALPAGRAVASTTVERARDASRPSSKGVATALLEYIIGEARKRGLRRQSLETGSGPAFEPALALYRKRGFTDGEAFGNYERSSFNQFLHMEL
jgi:GNAT superfamily N-acetyltransferase